MCGPEARLISNRRSLAGRWDARMRRDKQCLSAVFIYDGSWRYRHQPRNIETMYHSRAKNRAKKMKKKKKKIKREKRSRRRVSRARCTKHFKQNFFVPFCPKARRLSTSLKRAAKLAHVVARSTFLV